MLLVIFICIVIILIILTLKIKLIINIDENKSDIVLKIYILKKLLIGKIDLLKRINKKRANSITNEKEKSKKVVFKKIYNIVKKISLNVERLYLNIDIGTTDAILTSYLVAIMSNLVILTLKKSNLSINYKDCRYSINPVYKSEKVFNLKLNCIISTKNPIKVYRIFKGGINGK